MTTTPTPADLLAAVIDAGGLGFHAGPTDAAPPPGVGIVRVGIGDGRAKSSDAFDILLTEAADAPAPWVSVPDANAAAAHLRAAFDRQPVAAAVACQVLRMSLKVAFDEALTLESIAYSMVLASSGFASWRTANPPRPRADDDAERVALQRADGVLTIRLTRPAARNAVDARMRDALAEALAFAAADPEAASVVLCGEGPAFSAGGDLAEFGSAADPGLAHAIRTLRSATGRIHGLRERVTARLHGACIGAGIEMPAAAGWIVAAPDARLRLPEVGMGLIPGAGHASIPRRIGRHRTAWMALSGLDIDAPTALAWGLVDAVEP